MTECTIGDKERCDYEESQSVLLEPVQLTANITRNVGLPNRAFPNVDISLSLEAIKVRTCTAFMSETCLRFHLLNKS